MSLVLGIDTAGPVVGAALYSPDGHEEWSERVVRGADAVLIPAIESLLAGVGRPLDLVAVSVGPGAFTGLRVGVASALGFAVSLGVPVVPVSSLAARAALVREPRVLALLDARKGRVYAQTFDTTSEEPRPLGPARDAHLTDILPPTPFVVVGEGARLDPAAIVAVGGVIVPDPDRSPALEVARLGSLWRHTAEDPGAIALEYLRDADAKPQGKGGISR